MQGATWITSNHQNGLIGSTSSGLAEGGDERVERRRKSQSITIVDCADMNLVGHGSTTHDERTGPTARPLDQHQYLLYFPACSRYPTDMSAPNAATPLIPRLNGHFHDA